MNEPNGLSLRDWFAAMATDADIELIVSRSGWGEDGKRRLYQVPTRQQARYIHADAMLAARERKEAGDETVS